MGQVEFLDRHPNDLTANEQIDAALERAAKAAGELRIVEAVYRPEPGLEFLMLRLSDGRRLLIPREELRELKQATEEEACNLVIGPLGVDVWWPRLDDGLYLPEFLERRWAKERSSVAA
jgi:hypothetical protein